MTPHVPAVGRGIGLIEAGMVAGCFSGAHNRAAVSARFLENIQRRRGLGNPALLRWAQPGVVVKHVLSRPRIELVTHHQERTERTGMLAQDVVRFAVSPGIENQSVEKLVGILRRENAESLRALQSIYKIRHLT